MVGRGRALLRSFKEALDAVYGFRFKYAFHSLLNLSSWDRIPQMTFYVLVPQSYAVGVSFASSTGDAERNDNHYSCDI